MAIEAVLVNHPLAMDQLRTCVGSLSSKSNMA
jgi:hypothetical protein